METAKLIISKIKAAGFQAYIVGGAVRDTILKRNIHDVDITTSALPDDILKIFSEYKTFEIGKKFGTISVLVGSKNYEITTYRIESGYSDGRHPSDIEFSNELSDDLKRRDFTINAMAMDENGEIIDLYGGRKDLDSKIIRAVGKADTRMSEDYLRMLRAIRFSCQLNFKLDENLRKSIERNAFHIREISVERIVVEFNKILESDYVSLGLNEIKDLGILEHVVPEVYAMVGFNQENPFHHLDLWEHSVLTVENTPPILQLRLAALLHDVGKVYTKYIGEDGIAHYYGHDKKSVEVAIDVLKRLKYSNSVIDDVTVLISRHMDCMNEYTEKRVKRMLGKFGERNFRWILTLQRADVLSTKFNLGVENLDFANVVLEKILSEKPVVNQSGLCINGKDILELGFTQGPKIGMILKDVTERVIDDELKNTKSKVLDYIKENYCGD